jgi:hypothetical protein
MQNTDIPTLPFATFMAFFRGRWERGEHVILVAPTGGGKTTTASKILPIRSRVVVFATKVKDKTLTQQFPKFDVVRRWPPRSYQDRVLYWPSHTKDMAGSLSKQRKDFSSVLNKIFLEHRRPWAVYFDETAYMCEMLRLDLPIKMFLHQGRSAGITVINATQRPAFIPVVAYSSATYAFIWQTTEEKDRKRLSELGRIDKRKMFMAMDHLDQHSFLFVDTRRGDMVVSNTQR